MKSANAKLIETLRHVVGRRNVLTRSSATKRYRTGYRVGSGVATAVVRPGALVELWHVLQAVSAGEAIVIMQAANTGLTGGSTPHGDDYDRPVILVSTLRMRGVHLIDGGRQVICFPGTTLYELEAALRPLGREPHSVIGSSCIGASVVGGICNNSGGSLVRRGPAYTELSLFAQMGSDRNVRLVNHLGIELGDDPERVLDRIERGDFTTADVRLDPEIAASDGDYDRHVRQIDSPTPARFNADPRRLFEASGSAGKLAVFAVRLDTFAAEANTRVFCVGTDEPAELATIRRHMLKHFDTLPIAAEYIHRDAFDLADRYGKDTVFAIRRLGTDRLPWLFALKDRIDRWGGAGFSDRLLQRMSALLPSQLPARLSRQGKRFEHHLIMKVDGGMIETTRAYLESIFPTVSGEAFECDEQEGRIAFLHRFAVAGAAIRYRHVHASQTEAILALDIALPRSTSDWFEVLPIELNRSIGQKIYYGHFFCHVLHQDYVLAKGAEPAQIKQQICDILDKRGAIYPAEHNVGVSYRATTELGDFYQTLDPTNSMNPGIGQTSKKWMWE